jgi:phosphatidate cytidylyltransferase
MPPDSQWRLLDFQRAIDSPFTIWSTVGIGAILLATPLIIMVLKRVGSVSDRLYSELMLRYQSWLILVPLILLPILSGSITTIIGVGLLSVFCFREFSKVTHLVRERAIYVIATLGIVLLTFALLDNWYLLFVALTPLTICAVAVVEIIRDQPRGYIHRVSLGVLGFALFGSCLGHLGLLANGSNYRPMLILIFCCVELNDVFGFIVGKTLGTRKLAPNTSPGKTIGGALGAFVLTTLLFFVSGRFVFDGSILAEPIHLLAMGSMISLLGQFGDLMLSSIKRDLDIKDMAATIPGHGGFLDRFDSMILVAPAFFHYVNYFEGIWQSAPTRIFTGGN